MKMKENLNQKIIENLEITDILYFFITTLLIFVSIIHIENRTFYIKDTNDFYQIAVNPDGKYVIDNDIDMTA